MGQAMNERDRRLESEQALARARDSERLGWSSLVQRASDHFSARDAAKEGLASDPVEVWGRRIGRGLSVLFALALMWWLGLQLGWW
jgi:hypothetical protein